jgi:hypothetical protein
MVSQAAQPASHQAFAELVLDLIELIDLPTNFIVPCSSVSLRAHSGGSQRPASVPSTLKIWSWS